MRSLLDKFNLAGEEKYLKEKSTLLNSLLYIHALEGTNNERYSKIQELRTKLAKEQMRNRQLSIELKFKKQNE